MAKRLILPVLELLLLTPFIAGMAFNSVIRTTAPENVQSLVSTSCPRPTHPALYTQADLLRRDRLITTIVGPDPTCGYLDGSSDVFENCSPTMTCNFLQSLFVSGTSTFGAVGCCVGTSCSVRSTCVDSSQAAAGTTCSNSFCLICTDPLIPYCNRVTFPQVNARDFVCYTTQDVGAFLVMSTTYANQTSRTYKTSVLPFADADTTTASSMSTSPLSASPSATPTTVPNTSSTPIGAIVGGSVGGVALIVAVCLAVYCIRRSDKRRAARILEQQQRQSVINGTESYQQGGGYIAELSNPNGAGQVKYHEAPGAERLPGSPFPPPQELVNPMAQQTQQMQQNQCHYQQQHRQQFQQHPVFHEAEGQQHPVIYEAEGQQHPVLHEAEGQQQPVIHEAEGQHVGRGPY